MYSVPETDVRPLASTKDRMGKTHFIINAILEQVCVYGATAGLCSIVVFFTAFFRSGDPLWPNWLLHCSIALVLGIICAFGAVYCIRRHSRHIAAGFNPLFRKPE